MRTQSVARGRAREADSEGRRLSQPDPEAAGRVLTGRLGDLHTLAKALLEYETLSGDELVGSLKGVKPIRDEAEFKAPAGPRVSVPLAPRPDPELA